MFDWNRAIFGAIVATLALHVMTLAAVAQDNARERPSYRAVRAVTAPVLDGNLDEPAWLDAPEIAGFTQIDPEEGQPAKDQTRLKVVYDDDAIYFGLTMEDSGVPTPLLARRDSDLNNGDYVRISIDSQYDRLNGASFVVNASNVQMDLNLYNDIYSDSSWDAVWESAAMIVPGGWVAEVKIPYSQLRFPPREVHTWGFNVSRWNARTRESSRLVFTPKSESAFVSHFADLHGIEGIRPRRGLEVMPYGIARSDHVSQLDNPFVDSSAQSFEGGLDLKYGLTSSLRLTATINPDFGQVEVDPAVLNLSQFETFYPEKRPFFTEGANIFNFGNGPANNRWGFNMWFPTFFYSRRIGRSPQVIDPSQYSSVPGETTILGAAKVTGKAGEKWTIGVLDALTDEEKGTFGTHVENGDGSKTLREWDRVVEPMTNYFVARAMREYGKDSRAGILFTATNRDLPDNLEGSLRSDAYFAGVDGYTLFRDKSWILEWLTGGSLVEGSNESITLAQRSAARYYQRPDAGHVELDPGRTSLTGFMGRTMLAKQNGKWRPNIQLQALSPGFELNDMGFLPRVDAISSHAVLQYRDTDVKEHRRMLNAWVGKYQNWNFDGDLTANGVGSGFFLELKNYWWIEAWGGGRLDAIDDQRTRGGPAIVGPGSHYFGGGFGSDRRKRTSFNVWAESVDANDGGHGFYTGGTFTYRPSPAISLSITSRYASSTSATQYVTTLRNSGYAPTYGSSYIFAELDQESIELGIRTEWTVSPRLSFQLFLQPFIAAGDYRDFKQLVRPRDDEYVAAVAPFDPDFNLRSLRGSAVVRWEFRPGSSAYVVWNENRSEVAPIGDLRPGRDLSSLTDAPSRDVFLVKFSYWLPI
jgi:hypothetical protein